MDADESAGNGDGDHAKIAKGSKGRGRKQTADDAERRGPQSEMTGARFEMVLFQNLSSTQLLTLAFPSVFIRVICVKRVIRGLSS